MDPLSISLAVVSVATAIMDLLDLAHRIDDSIQQVSRNKDRALRLSTHIIDSVKELKDFCDEHSEELERSKTTKSAIFKLHREMQSVHCKIVAVQPSTKSKDQMFGGLVSWMKRYRVESELAELLDQIRDCYTKFTTFSVLRIEGRLISISQSECSIRRTEMPTSRPDLSAISCGVPANLSLFTNTQHTPPSQLGYEITADVIRQMYLRLQIDNVLSGTFQLASKTLQKGKLTQLEYSTSPALDHVINPEPFHSSVVSTALEIQNDILNRRSVPETYQNLIFMGTYFARKLRRLSMMDEAHAVLNAITPLCHSLISVKASQSIELVSILSALSALKESEGDIQGALAVAKEGLVVARGVPKAGRRTLRGKLLITSTLAHSAELIAKHADLIDPGEYNAAIQGAEEAVTLYLQHAEAEFHKQGEEVVTFRFPTKYALDDHVGNFILIARDLAFTLTDLFHLYRLVDREEDAAVVIRKSICVLRHVVELEKHRDDGYAETEGDLAFALYCASDPFLHQTVPTTMALSYSEESYSVFRRVCQSEPKVWGRDFHRCMNRRAAIMDTVDRKYEALLLRREAEFWRPLEI